MMNSQILASAAVIGAVLMIPAVRPIQSQTITSRDTLSGRVTSTRRIAVRKDQGALYRRQGVGGGMMMSSDRLRLDSLAAEALADRQRLDSALAAASSASARADEAARSLVAIEDSLRAVRGELSTVNARAVALGIALNDSVARLGSDVRGINNRWNNGSLFGHSGFYIGVGTGANFTTGTLNDIGYKEGLNVVVPIGYHKLGTALGVRGELGVQTFDGRAVGGWVNPDPKAYTAVGMITLHMPLNNAKSNNFYVMGGGGAYMFKDVTAGSALSDRLDGSAAQGTATRNVTKLAVTAGAGLDLHILGATSFFVQSRLTNLFGDASATGVGGSKNLRWIPLVAGFTLR